MAGGEDIVQNIVLAGQQDVIAGLDAIGEAGVKAFEALGTAASNLGNIGSAVAGFAGVAGAVAGVTAGIFALSDAAANNVVKMANFGDEMGTTTGNMGLFVTALNQAGNQTEDLTVAFRRIAVAVEADWPKVQKQVRESANTMKEDFIKVGEAAVELSFQSEKAAELEVKDSLAVKAAAIDVAKARIDAGRSSETAAIAQVSAIASVQGAENSLAAAEFNAQVARGNVSASQRKSFQIQAADAAVQAAQTQLQLAQLKARRDIEDAEIKRQQDLLALKQKRLALEEAQTKAAEDAALAPFKQAEAELKLSQAQAKQKEDDANSIEHLKQFVDNLAAGVSTDTDKVQLSAQNMIKGLIASVGPGVTALGEFGGSLGDLGARAPALFDVMKKVADVFHGTEDATLRAALATAIFGRGYSFSLVAALEEGSGALQKNMDRLKELGFEFTGFDEKVSRDFLKALLSLESELKILGTQFGNTFSPAFTAILREIQKAVEENRVGILQWASAIKDAALPVIAGFLRAIAGIDISKALQLNPEQIIQAEGWADSFDKVKRFVVDFAKGAKDVILNTLIPVFSTISSLLAAAAEQINKFFGTKLTAGDLGIGILVLAFTGLLPVIVAVGSALVGLFALIATNPFGLAALGVVVLGLALADLITTIKDNRTAINDFVLTKVNGAFNWLVDSFSDAATAVKRGFQDLAQQAKDTLLFASGAAIEANNKIIEAARKAEDEAVANARRIRDAANQTGDGSATDKPGSLTPSNAGVGDASTAVTAPIDAAKQKWFDLGKAIEETTSKSEKAFKDLGDTGGKAAGEAADAFTKSSDAIASSTKRATQSATNDLKNVRKEIQSGILGFGQGDRVVGGTPGPQIPAPQTTQIPKGQVLQDLSEINKALEDTNQKMIRTFGGRTVIQTKVPTEGLDGIDSKLKALGNTANEAGDNIIRVIGPGGKILSAIQGVKEVEAPVEEAAKALGDFGQKAQAIQNVSGDFANPFVQAANQVQQSWLELPDIFQQIFDKIQASADAMAEKVAADINAAKGGGSADSNNPTPTDSGSSNSGFSRGGLFRGTGGTDTNLAWLTDFEFIMNPSAVKHWGVGFMHAINRLEMPGFSMGGLFRSAGSRFNSPLIPAFAGGGLNRSLPLTNTQQRALTLVLGGQTFPGLSGPTDVVNALEQHAVQDQMKSSGFSPRWKR